MHKTIKYFILDVFTCNPYAGNPLSVFVDVGDLSTTEMQKIARELNFSETTFITSRQKKEEGYPVRIFTPKSEIPFAGHPTLGTAYVIHKYFEREKTEEVRLNLKVGKIPVFVNDDEYWMTQQQPQFGKELPASMVCDVLGLTPDDIKPQLPILEVSTGLPFIIVPLRSKKALHQAGIIADRYQHLANNTEAKGIMVFCEGSYELNQQIAARVFVPSLGIPEDPATGSAAGCLAAYLLKTKFYPQSEIELTIGQGYAIDRPSEIKIKAKFEGLSYHIQVGGKVKEIAHGEWNVLL